MEKKCEEKNQPKKNTSKLKSYYCPHCQKILMKGDVRKLNMTCQHCHKLINADEGELLKPEIFSLSEEE